MSPDYVFGSPQSPAVIDPNATDATFMGLLKGFLGGSDSVYTATFTGFAYDAAQDAFEIVAPSTHRVKIRGILLHQSSDFGDAEDEIVTASIIRGYTTSGSGGSTATPQPVRSGGAAASFTVEVNNETVASNGSPVTMYIDQFNVRAGFVYAPHPAEQVWLAASERGVVRLSAPDDALTLHGTLIAEQVPV